MQSHYPQLGSLPAVPVPSVLSCCCHGYGLLLMVLLESEAHYLETRNVKFKTFSMVIPSHNFVWYSIYNEKLYKLCNGCVGSVNYKPVERMATVGLSKTKTSVTPIAARSPISGGPKNVPDSKTFSPAAISHPRGRMSCPTTGSFNILISNSVHPSSASFVSSVSSTYQRENHARQCGVYDFKKEIIAEQDIKATLVNCNFLMAWRSLYRDVGVYESSLPGQQHQLLVVQVPLC